MLYFSIFKHPLKRDEIYLFSNLKDNKEIDFELFRLLEKEVIYKIDEYYLCDNKEEYVKRRAKGNNMASEIFPKAKKVSEFIAKFPYVEGVGISGSLSKGYHDEQSDLDFFIITAPNRLWIARTLLIMYKKIFLLNSKKNFCVNYFISSDKLEITEKNRFTATEYITLIPVCGINVFNCFYDKNKWAKSYYPNYNKTNFKTISVKKPYIVELFEHILSMRLGDSLDSFFLNITYKKWQQKFKNLDSSNFKIAMKSTKNVSKHHPQNFQKKVIDTLNEKYSNIEKTHNITLEPEHA